MTNPCSFTTELNAHLLLHCDLTVERDTLCKGDLTSEGVIQHTGTAIGLFGAVPVVQQGPLTASDTGAVDILWTASERDVVINLRTRVNQLETALKNLGLIS